MEQYLEMMTFLKFRIMKQEYDAVELLSSFHVFSPCNWNHFQVLFSTKLISHFHQGTHVDPRVIQIFQYRNSSHSSLVFFKTKEFMPEEAISVLLYEQNKKPFTWHFQIQA